MTRCLASSGVNTSSGAHGMPTGVNTSSVNCIASLHALTNDPMLALRPPAPILSTFSNWSTTTICADGAQRSSGRQPEVTLQQLRQRGHYMLQPRDACSIHNIEVVCTRYQNFPQHSTGSPFPCGRSIARDKLWRHIGIRIAPCHENGESQ